METKTKRTQYLQRKAALWTERASFDPHWKELSKFLLPRSGRFVTSDRNKGDKRYNSLYDNTATRSLGVLAAGLMAGMTSPARPWFRLATRDSALMEFEPVKQWLDEVTTLMRAVFSQSNTYRALHTSYEELACFGTSADLVLSDYSDVIRHYPLTVGEFALAANDRQEIDTLVREFDLTVAQIVKRYVAPDPSKKSGTLDWSNVSTTVKNLYDQGKGLDQWVPLVHIIEPREDRMTGKRDARNMPFASCTFEVSGNEDKVLRESGFRNFPVLAPRWHALGGDVYGTRCPAMESLGDIKQLQHAQLRKAQGIDYMVKPPLQAPAGTKSYEVDLLPGGISVTNMTGPSSGIKTAFEVKLDLQWLLEDIRDMRDRIRQSFYVDLFLMLAMSDRRQITAREVAERHEEKLIMLGPVLERLHNEKLKRKIDLTFDYMIEADIVPPPPREMQGQELNVVFVSLLAQAQQLVSAQTVDRYVGSLGVIAQFKPDVLDKFDSDMWADKYADILGLDPDLIVANDKVAIVRQQRAQQAAAQSQLQAAQQAADAAKSASQASTGGENVLTDVMAGLTGYT